MVELVKGVVTIASEDDSEAYETEGWIAQDRGLACTPYHQKYIVSLKECKEWILTHLSSGRSVWLPFPPDKHYARIFLEEIAATGIDFTQNGEQLHAKYTDEAVSNLLRNAHNRTEQRWREREETQVEQLVLF